MAFTDTTNAPHIYDEKSFVVQTCYVSLGTPTGYERTITTTKHRFVGLTRAASDSIAEAKQDTHTDAVSQRMNPADMYQVIITEDTATAWSAL